MGTINSDKKEYKGLKNKRIAVYGTGGYCKENLRYLDSAFHIVCFTDSDSEKWDKEPFDDGRNCVRPENLEKYDVECVLIAVKSDAAIAEIKSYINELSLEHISLKKILPDCIRLWDQRQLESLNDTDTDYTASGVEDGRIARYVECYMLRQACNLRCSYCFVGQSRELAEKVVPLIHKPEFIAKALSKERLGGSSLISICCDGEPLISYDMVTLIRCLLEEGHYVYLISNGTLKTRMDQICNFPRELLNRFFIRFSYHYFELERLNLFDTFFDNIKRFYDAGGSFTVFLVGNEGYLPVLNDLKERCVERLGALPHVDYERDETGGDGSVLTIKTDRDVSDYRKVWESFDSEFLRFRERTDGKVTGKCNAGNWVVHLDLMTGELSRCPVGQRVANIYDDISSDIPFEQNSRNCPYKFCVCAPVFFAFGSKEDMRDAPTFYELWNRKMNNGQSWIRDEMKGFLSGRLYESYGK